MRPRAVRDRASAAPVAEAAPSDVVAAPDADVVDRWKKVFQEERAFKWHAAKHLAEAGFEMLSPYKLPTDVLESFLAKYADASFIREEMASDELVARVKALERKDPASIWQWQRFCTEEVPYPIRSPRKLPASYVQKFLSDYEGGRLEQVEMVSDDVLKELGRLRKSCGTKYWSSSCKDLSYGIVNPEDFSAEAAARFLGRFQLDQKGDREKVDPKAVVETRTVKHGRREVVLGFKGAMMPGERNAVAAAVQQVLEEYSTRGMQAEPKKTLNALMQLILKRNVVRSEVVYQVLQEDSDEPPFVVTVTLSGALRKRLDLTDDVRLQFTGAEGSTAKEAEANAARRALEFLEAFRPRDAAGSE